MKNIFFNPSFGPFSLVKRADQDYDASGTFEADEIIVTAGSYRKNPELNLNEGDALKPIKT